MVRTFKHAMTGREIRVADDSRTSRLVEADENWSEIKPKKTTSSKEAGDGDTGSPGRRRGGSRKAPQRRGDNKS